MTLIGTLEVSLGDATGAVTLELDLTIDGTTLATNRYEGRIGAD